MANMKQSKNRLSLISNFYNKFKYFRSTEMSEISNLVSDDSIYHQQVACQQQMMISVLKQEIVRLQEQILVSQKQRDQYAAMYQKALQEIQNLKQKIAGVRQNNQSLIQTFQVFQRQFIKRDYNNIFTQLKQKQKKQDGPLFMELIRNMKAKFNTSLNEPVKIPERSYISDYYGFFFHSEVEEPEIQLYQELTSSKKLRVSKIRSFGKKNFFNQKFRHIFWFNSIENTQKITFQLYEVLSDTYESDRENKLPQNSIIDLDLKRMDLKIEEEKSQNMKVEIKKCLQLFRLYRPDIGYVQGMSYFAWMLLIRMQGYQAFVCFTNIMLHDPFIHSLYMFKKDRIDKIVKFYEQCLEDKKPKLAKHMTKLEVQPQLFIIEWAYTFFSRAFNLRIVSKIWDLWFSEGFNTFFRVTMAIMDMLQTELLQQKQNDRIIEILRGQTLRVDEGEFIKYLNRQKLFEDLTFTNDFKK